MISIWAALLPPIFGLLGVVVGGVIQFMLAERASLNLRRDRKEDIEAAYAKEGTKLKEDRALPALKVARHLEQYALLCAETVSMNASGSGYEGYSGFPDWKPWPKTISWELLSALDSAKAQDFEVRVSLHERKLSGNIEFGANDATDIAEYAAETSAIAGVEAWEIAKAIRSDANLPAFRFGEHVWNYSATLSEAFEEKQRKERDATARRGSPGDIDL